MEKLQVVPRQYSLVKFIPPKGYEKIYEQQGMYPYPRIYIFLGEIPNMQEHCVVFDRQATTIRSCFHTSDFVELTEGEI
jgi:hypothetical protein